MGEKVAYNHRIVYSYVYPSDTHPFRVIRILLFLIFFLFGSTRNEEGESKKKYRAYAYLRQLKNICLHSTCAHQRKEEEESKETPKKKKTDKKELSRKTEATVLSRTTAREKVHRIAQVHTQTRTRVYN